MLPSCGHKWSTSVMNIFLISYSFVVHRAWPSWRWTSVTPLMRWPTVQIPSVTPVVCNNTQTLAARLIWWERFVRIWFLLLLLLYNWNFSFYIWLYDCVSSQRYIYNHLCPIIYNSIFSLIVWHPRVITTCRQSQTELAVWRG